MASRRTRLPAPTPCAPLVLPALGTVVCLGLSDPKGIAISFFHRRPDRVVAVNTALKTVSTVGRLWDTEDRVRRNLASTRRRGAGREFLCGSRRRGLLIA
ncbi:hypothetical protein ACOMHN_041926 [Nucella lapillus]